MSAKKIILEVTEPQLRAVVEITNDISSMMGGGDFDKEWNKYVKLIDRMLRKNGYKRQYN